MRVTCHPIEFIARVRQPLERCSAREPCDDYSSPRESNWERLGNVPRTDLRQSNDALRDPQREHIKSATRSRSHKAVHSRKRPCPTVEKSQRLSGGIELHETPAPPKKCKGYERQPRHKTRADRYECKPQKSTKDKHPAKKQKTKCSKRKKRSALNEDFHASNVTQNRLTVKVGGAQRLKGLH